MARTAASLLLWLTGFLTALLPVSARAYVLQGHPWPSDQPIVMDLQLGSPGYTLEDHSTSWNQVAQAALDIWNAYLGDGVYFQSETTADTPAQHDGINSVFFSDTIFGDKFGKDTLAITAYFYSSSTNDKTEADVIFNTAVKFDSYRGLQEVFDLFDLRRIAIHEFGHVLGLDHVPQDTVSIMTPYATDIDTVQQDDINGVEAIYGLPPARPLPVITSTLTAEGELNEEFTYQITANNSPLHFLTGTLPPGLSVNSSTGVISGTPTAQGVYEFTISATNVGGTGSAVLVVTINSTPVISGTLDYIIRLNRPFRYVPTVSGNPTSFVTTPLPVGLTLDPATGVISGTPTVAGEFNVQMYPVNANGNGAKVTLNLRVSLLDPAVVTVHEFRSYDGSSPQSPLVQANDGNFYGMTSTGGVNGIGTVYQLAPNGTVTTIHQFNDTDGGYLQGGLIQGTDGNLYGVSNNTVFRLTLDGVETILHTFANLDGNSGSTLLQAKDGNFYGVTERVVFRLTADGVYTELHTFYSAADGYGPGTLIQAADGNFYGTTSGAGSASGGGAADGGTIFKLTPDGVATTLHHFAAPEGLYPNGPLVQAPDGSFYGTTPYGGDQNLGTIFKLAPDGTLTTLHSFSFIEGERPSALILATDGSFYGTARGGGISYAYLVGAAGGGTLFKITPDGLFSTFHLFEDYAGDGYQPCASLLEGGDGNLYGTTLDGQGLSFGLDDGTIFKRPLSAPFLTDEVTPTVTLAATTPQVVVGSGGTAVITLTLSAPQSTDIYINYTVKGSAVNGTDYVELKGTKKIKAGKTTKPIKVIPQGGLSGFAKKTVKITLISGDGYTLGATVAAKVKILAAQ